MRRWLWILFLLPLWAIPGHVVATTTYTVNVTTDTGAGVGTTGDLRYAINQVNAGGGGDTIQITATGTITLGSALPALAKNVTITGPGATLLTVSGNHAVTVLQVNSGTTVEIGGLTIADGTAQAGGFCGSFVTCGGGISNAGTLSVTNSIVTGNSVLFRGAGGGIYNQGILSVTNSTFTGNTAPNGLGGGISNGGTLSVMNSTFLGNDTSNFGSGGGIYTEVGTANVTNSTFFGNSAPGGGGAIGCVGSTLTITNSTITGNTAISAGNGGGLGGGIGNAGGTVVTLTNTLIAGNSASDNTGGSNGDLFLLYANGIVGNNNLIGDGSIRYLSGSNNLNVPAMLGTLGDYGGPTQTIPLLPGSPAINAGAAVGQGPAGNPVPATDQRGLPRVGPPDIGAYEVQTATLTCGGSTTPTIKVGQTLLCTALVQSSDPTIVAADGVGNITGVRAGQATITATQGSVPGTVTVTVVAPTPIGVSVPPAPQSRPSGTTGGSGSPSPAPAARPVLSGPSSSTSGPTPNPAPPRR